MPLTDAMWDVQKIAKELGVTRQRIYQRIAMGDLPPEAQKIGRVRFWRAGVASKWVAKEKKAQEGK